MFWLPYGNLKLIFVTLGAKGCFYRMGEKFGRLPTYDVKTVDTTGAGAAFWVGNIIQNNREKEYAQ